VTGSLYVGIDCEMAQSLMDVVPIKITVVDETGLIMLDTLINPQAIITHSCENIHGISAAWLHDAPNLNEVREHLLQICTGANYVGHSVRHDLKALGITVPYVDTVYYEDRDTEFTRGQQPGLKLLAEKHLNAKI
jgi:DNA polymerase III epsilon subunit-like protein